MYLVSDLIFILVFLTGAAVLGFLLGRRSVLGNSASLKEQLREQQRAYTETREQLNGCTAKRRELERTVRQLKRAVNNTEPATVATATNGANPTIPPVKTTKNKRPIASKRQPARPTAEPVSQPTSSAQSTLDRIRTRASQINFDRIGRASADKKDDLKQIEGLGHFVEKKLNALGIYTLKQISHFTLQDEEEVNKALEFAPGKITRGRWVEQAKKLR